MTALFIIALVGWAVTGGLWWRERELRKITFDIAVKRAMGEDFMTRVAEALAGELASAGRDSKSGTARMMARMAEEAGK